MEQNKKYSLYFNPGTTWGMTAICFFVPEIKLSGVILSNCEMGSNPRYAVMYKLIDLVMGLPSKDYSQEDFDSYRASNTRSWEKDHPGKKEYKPALHPEKSLVGEYSKDELFGDAKITKEQIKEIATLKMPDLNAATIESAMSMIEGTARSMGVVVVD